MQTAVLKFYKDLEKYALIKDSQFILNIPLQLLSELLEQTNSPKEENKYSFGEVSAYSPTQENKPLAYHTIEAYPKIEMSEISDEEINKQAEHIEEGIYRMFFKTGAKWYREQLKNKS